MARCRGAQGGIVTIILLGVCLGELNFHGPGRVSSKSLMSNTYANDDDSIRWYRIGIRLAIREVFCDSINATGSGRSLGTAKSASDDLGITDLLARPKSRRS